jgi:hypothetical protein
MGAHRKNKKHAVGLGKENQKKAKTIENPPLPSPIGKRKRIKNIFGDIRHLKIIDQIGLLQSTDSNKYIVLQKIEIEEDGVIEFRFGYYMIGVQPGARGRWVWGQFCLLIPKKDLNRILSKAKKKKWL